MALKKYLAELIGTFMLVFVGAGAVTLLSLSKNPVAADVVVAALAHSFMVIAVAATFGHISGAQINPGVTLGLMVGGKQNVLEGIVYIAMQIVGGVLAALVLRWVFPAAATLGNTLPAAGIDTVKIIVLEAFGTFILTSTVFQAAVYGRGGPATPLLIAFTLAGLILAIGPLTGASFNVARTLGPAIVTNNFTELPAYLIGILGGGALAGVLHGYFFAPEKK